MTCWFMTVHKPEFTIGNTNLIDFKNLIICLASNLIWENHILEVKTTPCFHSWRVPSYPIICFTFIEISFSSLRKTETTVCLRDDDDVYQHEEHSVQTPHLFRNYWSSSGFRSQMNLLYTRNFVIPADIKSLWGGFTYFIIKFTAHLYGINLAKSDAAVHKRREKGYACLCSRLNEYYGSNNLPNEENPVKNIIGSRYY